MKSIGHVASLHVPQLTSAGSFAATQLILRRVHVHAAAFLVEPHLAVDQGKQRVVLARADVRAGPELRAALADDDRAGRDRLAAEPLDAPALRSCCRGRCGWSPDLSYVP